MHDRKNDIAELILPSKDLDVSIRFFEQELGFRLVSIFPADSPRIVIMSGSGLRVRLEKHDESTFQNTPRIRINADREGEIVSPDGLRVEFVDSTSTHNVPEFIPGFVVNKQKDDWIDGRAGMKYRDLIPGRFGGYLIASQIHVPDAGPVPDYVHYHNIKFQIIHCVRGWARLVYEDQGEPFVFEAGDCVLQPPGIRHRVLETSGSFDVVEVSCPAEHETHVEHDLELPNGIDKDRIFEGQKFIWSKASEAHWESESNGQFEQRITGIREASAGLVNVRMLRSVKKRDLYCEQENGSWSVKYVLHGDVTVSKNSESSILLGKGDTLVQPGGYRYDFENCSDRLEILEVYVNQ